MTTLPCVTLERSLHIEGMDLAGKSTATAALATAYPDALLRRNSLIDSNPIYELADTLRRAGETSPQVLGRLYVAALAEDLERLADFDVPRIQDSTILLRSLAYNAAIGEREVVGEFLRAADSHPRFGTSVVLTASIEARLQRLEARRREAPDEVAPDDLLVVRNPDLFREMEATLVEYALDLFNAQIIDTSNLTSAEVVESIVRNVAL
jgi:thymidylate kinase